MTVVVNVHEAKTHLSRLLERVRRGEDIVVAKAGTPVARLVPVGTGGARRSPGTAEGLVHMADDFDAPMPDEWLDAFEKK